MNSAMNSVAACAQPTGSRGLLHQFFNGLKPAGATPIHPLAGTHVAKGAGLGLLTVKPVGEAAALGAFIGQRGAFGKRGLQHLHTAELRSTVAALPAHELMEIASEAWLSLMVPGPIPKHLAKTGAKV